MLDTTKKVEQMLLKTCMKAEHRFRKQTHPTNPRCPLQQRSPQLRRGRFSRERENNRTMMTGIRNAHRLKTMAKKQIENLDRCLDPQIHKHPFFHVPRIPTHIHHHHCCFKHCIHHLYCCNHCMHHNCTT